jgi:hypothetical protein
LHGKGSIFIQQALLTAAAINLNRIVAWLEGIPLAKTRKSHFALLAEATV